MAKAMAGSPATMGHPIRRVRVPSLSANFFGQPWDGRLDRQGLRSPPAAERTLHDHGIRNMTKLIDVCSRAIRVEGRIVRIARPHGDRYRFLDDPAQIIKGLRTCGDTGGFVHVRPEATRE